MKPDRSHCPRCGFGTGRVERVCWDCRCKGAKAPKRREPGHAPVRGYRCETCGEGFSSERAFDIHRVGEFERHATKGHPARSNARRCLTAAEMAAKGLVLRDGLWGQAPKRRGERAA